MPKNSTSFGYSLELTAHIAAEACCALIANVIYLKIYQKALSIYEILSWLSASTPSLLHDLVSKNKNFFIITYVPDPPKKKKKKNRSPL